MKLISEEIQHAEYLVEEKNGKKNYSRLRGVFLQSDIKNRNGRVYENEILAKEVKQILIENLFIKNRAFGELGHPDGPTVNLERVSSHDKVTYTRRQRTLSVKRKSWIPHTVRL